MARRKPDPELVITETTLDVFKPNVANHRDHDSRNLEIIGGSLDQFGPARSIVAVGNTIYCGNGTLEEAQKRGLTALVVRPNRNQLVVVDRSDLTTMEAVGLSIADNRSTDTSHDDEAKVAALLSRLPDATRRATGYTDREVVALLARVAAASKVTGEPSQPASEEPSVKTCRCPQCGFSFPAP